MLSALMSCTRHLILCTQSSYLAACKLSSTSRNANSRARTLSLSFPVSPRESGASRCPVSYVAQFLFVPVGVGAGGVWPVRRRASRSLMTPVLCQVRALNFVSMPPAGRPFKRSTTAGGVPAASILEVRVGCEPSPSRFPCRGVRRVIPSRCCRISSTL